jgi:hypothetical protein
MPAVAHSHEAARSSPQDASTLPEACCHPLSTSLHSSVHCPWPECTEAGTYPACVDDCIISSHRGIKAHHPAQAQHNLAQSSTSPARIKHEAVTTAEPTANSFRERPVYKGAPPNSMHALRPRLGREEKRRPGLRLREATQRASLDRAGEARQAKPMET